MSYCLQPLTLSLKDVKQALDCPVTTIGEIVDDLKQRVTLVDNGGNVVPLSYTGWEHFKSKA